MSYYEETDLARFPEMSKFKGELMEQFFQYYNQAVNSEGALNKKTKALIALAAQYKEELWQKFGLVFNKLFAITNMPIHRLKKQLQHAGAYEAYMQKLLHAFNPGAVDGLMC